MCVCVCVCVKVTQLCLTLCNPIDCSPPCSSVHGILWTGILEWVAFPFSRVPTQELNPGLLHCRWIIYHLSHQGSPCSNDLVKSTVRIRDDVCKTASARHTTGAQKEAVLFDYAWFLLGSYRCSYAVCETFYKTKGKKKNPVSLLSKMCPPPPGGCVDKWVLIQLNAFTWQTVNRPFPWWDSVRPCGYTQK